MNDEIEKSIAEELVGEWELKEGKLVKLFQFSSFMNAIDFVKTLNIIILILSDDISFL